MNTSTLGDLPIYDPPRTGLPTNRFCAYTGAARWGAGAFLMRFEDYKTLEGGGAATQTLSLSDGTRTVTFPVVVAGCRPYSVALRPDEQDADALAAKDLVEVVVFDPRCKRVNPVTRAYNVQKEGFPGTGANASDYYPATLLEDAQYNWQDILDDLNLANAWPELPTTFKPRNIIFDSVPWGRAVDNLAARLGVIIGYKLSAGSTANDAAVWAYLFGQSSDENDTVAEQAKPFTIGGKLSERNPKRPPGKFLVTFKGVDSAASDPYENREYTKTITADDGDPAHEHAVYVGEYVAIRSGSSWANQTELDAVATFMAGRAGARLTCDIDERTYAGLFPFHPDGKYRAIMWTTDRTGARTTVRTNEDRDFSPLEDARRSMDALSNQLVVGLGETNTGMSMSGARYVWGAPSRPNLGLVVCKGPNNEDDFDDNRYWVKLAHVSNADDDATSPLSFGFATPTRVVCVTNLAEQNESTHHVYPGTPLLFWSEPDRSAPSLNRFVTSYIDPTQGTRQPCDRSDSPPSSSGSGPSGDSSGASSGDSGGPSSGGPSGSTGGSSTPPSGSDPGSTTPPSGGGSEKSTAIVPASWTKTGYAALFVSEAPEVRFDDVLVAVVPRKNQKLAIDPRYIEVCSPDSIEVCGVSCDQPVTIGASVRGSFINLKFGRAAPNKKARVVIRLTGIRKGFAGVRFPARSAKQFQQNERFIRSAYGDE